MQGCKRCLDHKLQSFKSFVVNIQDKSKKEINFTELIKILMKNISNSEKYFSLRLNEKHQLNKFSS